MNKKATFFLLTLVLLVLAGGYLLFESQTSTDPEPDGPEDPASNQIEKQQKKADRANYYFRMLRDPATDALPDNIRNREIQVARRIPERDDWGVRFRKGGEMLQADDYSWESAGPFDIGGRTRALAVDQRDPETIIAGGVSGGIWKSTDGGDSWEMKTSDLTSLSVTSLAQDPTEPDTWYYVTGEFVGNSATDRGFRAPYYGTGVFRSTDNGESWERIPSSEDTDGEFNSPYDFMSRVIVTPNGTVFVASNGFGIFRLDEQSDEFELVLGDPGEHAYADVVVNSEGDLLAVLSELPAGEQYLPNEPGVYLSEDDGDNWEDITPDDFPSSHERSYPAFAPSEDGIAYILTYEGSGEAENEDVSFFHLDLSDGTAEDRSENLPDFGEPVGFVNTQFNYNMTVAVHPEDPELVLVGTINLFRSDDGFASQPSGGYDDENDAQKDEYWVGGYDKDNDISKYPDQHPDQHVIFFDPDDADRMWAGHDGGLSVTDDITADEVTWENKNEGYITTQFYTAAIPDEEGDDRIMGGTQDNGTPFFRHDNGQGEISNPTEDISTGDGGYAYFTSSYFYVASQNGRVIRYNQDSDGNIDSPSFAYVSPSSVEDQLFVHPYVVDPNDEGTIYYPGSDGSGNSFIWRNTEADEISNNTNSEGTTDGWEQLTDTEVDDGYLISTVTVSRNPADVLVYGASSENGSPLIYRLLNARTGSEEPEEINISDAEGGAYVHDIEVSPINADEMLVILSNYNIESVFHTTDGGDSWQSVEGNLAGGQDELGPSVRSATIIPAEEGNVYFLGTSTGIYSTSELDEENTSWEHEANDTIGHAVVEQINARYSDGTIVAGSHGRGAFLGSFGGTTSLPSIALSPARAQAGEEVTITSSNFEFEEDESANEVLFGSAEAHVISAQPNELVVQVPRGAIDRESESSTTQVKVTSGDRAVSQTFEVIPPDEYNISQNYPNPFDGVTSIPFDIETRSAVTIQIYNTTGQKVLEPLRQEIYEEGSYAEEVDLSQLSSGVYFVRFIAQPYDESTEVFVESEKMTLVK